MTSLITSSRSLPATADAFIPVPAERSRPQEIVGIVLQRLWPALGAGAAVVLVVLLALWRTTPSYFAIGSLVIEPQRQNLATSAEPPQPGLPPDTSAIDTQVEVLKSPALAEAVARRLKLYNDPEFNSAVHQGGAAPNSAREPTPTEMATVTENVQRHATIRRAGLTYVVGVGFSSHSPVKAAQIANTYMDTYLQRQLDEKIAAVTKANSELGPQVERMRADAQQAEANVQQYKVDHNLLSAEGSTMAEQEVSTLNQQIAQARADAAEKQARLNAALGQVSRGGGGSDIGAAVTNETIMTLRKQEAELSQKLAQLQTDFKPEYPEVKRTQAELDDTRAEIQAELNRILSSVRAEADAASQRAGSLLSSRGGAQSGLAANNEAQVGLVALQQRADATKQIYEAYLNRAKDVAAQGSVQQPDAVVDSLASRPPRPYSPNKRLGAALALLLGLLASTGTIVVAELWNRRLRSQTDVEARLGVPFAGVVPQVKPKRRLGRPANSALVAKDVVDNRFSSFAESFRNLRTFLAFGNEGAPGKLLAVTSSLPREGKTVTSLCLARTLAYGGAKVILVDCDLRRRGLSKITGHMPAGVVEVIQGEATLDDAVIRDPSSGAWILPATASGPLPHDLFATPAVDRLLEALTRHFDHVILELPPILGLADARILAAKADRVLYLVHWNRTPARTAQAGLDILRGLGANVIGAALTQVNENQQAHYGYSDSSDYFKHYRQYYMTVSDS